MVANYIKRLRVKTASPQKPVRTLSGGNAQKVVLAKWLATDPLLLILDEPTAGVDIGSKTEIVDIIRSFADQGRAVLVISSEPAELLALSDRILVMAGGRIVREISSEEIEELGRGINGYDPQNQFDGNRTAGGHPGGKFMSATSEATEPTERNLCQPDEGRLATICYLRRVHR